MRDYLAASIILEDIALVVQLVHELFDEYSIENVDLRYGDALDKSIVASIVLLNHQILKIAHSRWKYHQFLKGHRDYFLDRSMLKEYVVNYISIKRFSKTLDRLEYVIIKKNTQIPLPQAPFDRTSILTPPKSPSLSSLSSTDFPGSPSPPIRRRGIATAKASKGKKPSSKPRYSRPNYPPNIQKYLKDWIALHVLYILIIA